MENKASLELVVSRNFKVPVGRLFEAWNTENDLRQWWRPMGNELKTLKNELREGGEVRYIFGSDKDEHSITIRGIYKEVIEGQRLVYTWNWEVPSDSLGNSEFLLTVEFKGQGENSQLQVKQENFSQEEAIQPHREGWEKALNDLENYLQAGK